MKYIKILLIYISAFMLSLLHLAEAKAVDLGPLSVTTGFCQQVDKVGAIVNSFTIVQWPVGGFPGITMGMLSNTSVVVDFCNFITQLETLDTTQAIFAAANYGNTLTGKKWDDHLQQADRTFNILNSTYDFENGTTRQGAFESASTYRELNDYIKDSYKWSNKTFNGREAELKTRGQREADMNKLAGLAFQRSFMKEMINCPEPQDNKNYSEIYQKSIVPQEKRKSEAEEDFLFYKDKLLSMGPRFLDNEDDMKQYIEDVEKMENIGIGYEVKPKEIKVSTTKADPKKKDASGKPVQNTHTLTRKYQDWTVKVHDRTFDDFNMKYRDRWSGFVTQKIASSSFGLLDNAKGRAEDEFMDLSYECNQRKLMEGYDPTKGNYDFELEKRQTECKNNIQMNEKKVASLLTYYVDKMQDRLYNVKAANALIWTIESREMGRSRVVTPGQVAGENFQQEQIKCSETLTPAEMDKLGLKQQSINNELNELLLKETQKQTQLKETELQAQSEYMKEFNIRRDSMEKKQAEAEKERQVSPSIIPPRGGFGGGNN